jgi:hypothetical protein
MHLPHHQVVGFYLQNAGHPQLRLAGYVWLFRDRRDDRPFLFRISPRVENSGVVNDLSSWIFYKLASI